MPYVHIRITDEGVTADHKAALIEGVTRLLQEVLGKNPGDHRGGDRRSAHRQRRASAARRSRSAVAGASERAATGPLGNTRRRPWDICRSWKKVNRWPVILTGRSST